LSIKEQLQPTLDWLQQRFTLSDEKLGELARLQLIILNLSVQDHLEPNILWLQGRLQLDQDNLQRVFLRPTPAHGSTQLIGSNMEENLEPTLVWLQDQLNLDGIPSLFTQPNVNCRDLLMPRVTKMASDLYKKSQYGFGEEYVMFPYMVVQADTCDQGCKIKSVISPADVHWTDGSYMACMIDQSARVEALFRFFFEENLSDVMEAGIGSNKDSEDYPRICFGFFLEQLSSDWSDFLNHMLLKSEHAPDFLKGKEKPPLGIIYHRCPIMISSLTSLPLACVEGNHRLMGDPAAEDILTTVQAEAPQVATTADPAPPGNPEFSKFLDSAK
jgi:hypothetical protein